MERLREHQKSNINPLLPAHCACCVEDVLQSLTPPPRYLVELEVVTVKHLVSKISNSFAAASLHNGADIQTPPSKCPGALLPEAPVFLLGVLVSSVSTRSGNGLTGLTLADTTGKIACEVS